VSAVGVSVGDNHLTCGRGDCVPALRLVHFLDLGLQLGALFLVEVAKAWPTINR
jgi:hypothetical protein